MSFSSISCPLFLFNLPSMTASKKKLKFTGHKRFVYYSLFVWSEKNNFIKEIKHVLRAFIRLDFQPFCEPSFEVIPDSQNGWQSSLCFHSLVKISVRFVSISLIWSRIIPNVRLGFSRGCEGTEKMFYFLIFVQ